MKLIICQWNEAKEHHSYSKTNSSGSKNGGKNSESENKNDNYRFYCKTFNHPQKFVCYKLTLNMSDNFSNYDAQALEFYYLLMNLNWKKPPQINCWISVSLKMYCWKGFFCWDHMFLEHNYAMKSIKTVNVCQIYLLFIVSQWNTRLRYHFVYFLNLSFITKWWFRTTNSKNKI
jgi:hypothetical protein